MPRIWLLGPVKGMTGSKALLEGLGKKRSSEGIVHSGYPSYLEGYRLIGLRMQWESHSLGWE